MTHSTAWKRYNVRMIWLSLLYGLFLIGAVYGFRHGLITGPIATESAPAGLISSAIGIVVATGEIFGGGIAPAIGGAIAQSKGIENILWMPLVGVSVGAVVCLFLKETAPAKVRDLVPASANYAERAQRR